MIQQICQQLPSGAMVFGFIGYSAWEWFMGHTVFGSTLGLLVEHPLTTFMDWVKSKVNGPK